MKVNIAELTAKKKASYAKKPHKDMDFLAFACYAISENIKAKPIRYRGYGMYWYALKQVLIKQGYDFGIADFGKHDDLAMANDYAMSDDEQTVVMADSFWHEMARTSIQGNREYYLKNGELYVLNDDDMESLIW